MAIGFSESYRIRMYDSFWTRCKCIRPAAINNAAGVWFARSYIYQSLSTANAASLLTRGFSNQSHHSISTPHNGSSPVDPRRRFSPCCPCLVATVEAAFGVATSGRTRPACGEYGLSREFKETRTSNLKIPLPLVSVLNFYLSVSFEIFFLLQNNAHCMVLRPSA